MRPITDTHPIGNFVVVGVAVIGKAAMFDEEAASVLARPLALVHQRGGYRSNT